MSTVYLGLGSNQAPEDNLRAAINALRSEFGEVVLSPVYASAAVGFDGPTFLNAAARIQTDMPILELDAWLHALEDAQGRRRDVPRFSSRPLDIDILLVDDWVWQGPGNLKVPRDDVHSLVFVLKPLCDIAPALIHPVQGRSLQDILADLDPAQVDALRIVPLD